MGWLDIHKDRLGISHDNTGTSEEYTSDTITYLEDVFDQSPSYQVVNIDGVEHGVRIVNNREYQTANEFEQNLVLLKPNTVIDRGAYMTYVNNVTKKEETWLVVFYHFHKIYPKAFVRYCTKKLKFKNGTILPCVVTNKISSSAFIQENTVMTMPKDSLAIYVKATEETMSTLEGHRFIIDNVSFEVQSINPFMNTEDGVGVVEMAIKKVPSTHEETEEIESDKDGNVDNTTDKEENQDGWEW